MATAFAALIFRPDLVPDRALSQGFAVALAGWDLPAPRLAIADLPGAPGWAAAFYESGQKAPRGAEDEAFDLACELFEDDVPPALAVLDAAAELGREGARVYAFTYAEGIYHDDAWRFDAGGFLRHFVHEGEEGVEAGTESPEGAVDVDLDLPEGSKDDARALDGAVRPHRGSTFLSAELGTPAVPALVGALYLADRRVPIRLVDPAPEAVAAEVSRLNRALGRVTGRGSFAVPEAVAGRAAPAVYRAFAGAYDWADPHDPTDLYRGLSIGAIEGTLTFGRGDWLAQLDADPAWRQAAARGLFPVARILGSTLGNVPGAIVALSGEGDALTLVRPGRRPVEAGPTLGELIRYLALGWSKRTEAEEDMIGALMLRARVRVEAAQGSDA